MGVCAGGGADVGGHMRGFRPMQCAGMQKSVEGVGLQEVWGCPIICDQHGCWAAGVGLGVGICPYGANIII